MKVKGNGSIRQVKNKKGEPVKNSWQLILSLGYDPLTNRRRQECRAFRGSKTMALRALNEFRLEVERGLKIDADKVTFGEYARQWHEARKASGRLAPTTIERMRYTMEHLLRYLGAVPLGDIDTVTVRNFYIALANDGTGQTSAAKVAIALKQILKQAVNDDIILRNPCDRVEAPKAPKAEKGTALDEAGARRLVDALYNAESTERPFARPEQQRLTSDMAHTTAALLALGTGLRRGEVLGLSWGDVNLNNATLIVRRSLCNMTGDLKEPKTATSKRTISLDAQLVKNLIQWKIRQSEYLLLLCIQQNAETPIITTETGGRMDGNNLDRWWRAFREQNGFNGLRFHDLRHTHATLLVSNSLNNKAVSSRLGHANVGITLDLYAHALREDDLKAAAIMSPIMARRKPASRLVGASK